MGPGFYEGAAGAWRLPSFPKTRRPHGATPPHTPHPARSRTRWPMRPPSVAHVAAQAQQADPLRTGLRRPPPPPPGAARRRPPHTDTPAPPAPAAVPPARPAVARPPGGGGGGGGPGAGD